MLKLMTEKSELHIVNSLDTRPTSCLELVMKSSMLYRSTNMAPFILQMKANALGMNL